VITHSISGELYEELRHGTSLDDGEGTIAKWGYGPSREADVEVYRMVHAATRRKQGFGHSYTMTGSVDAWRAIRDYVEDRAQMELTMSGDFDRSMGSRFVKQGVRIAERIVEDDTRVTEEVSDHIARTFLGKK